MSSEIKVCPNCGAGIVGNIENCPRCDHPLTDASTHQFPASAPEEPEAWEDAEESVGIFAAALPENEMVIEEPDVVELESTAVAMPTPPPGEDLPEDDPADDDNFGDFVFDASTGPVDAAMIGASAPSEPESDTQESVRPQVDRNAIIPTAPYTPPPLRDTTTTLVPYSYPSNYYLEQRVAAYRQGNYELVSYSPFQVTMAYGKPLGLVWWLLAMLSGIGIVWYFMILMASSFTKDRVYLIVERDGTLYEDGAGAAHVRTKRSRVGRRWGFLGTVIFFISLIWFIGMVGVSFYGIDRFRPELEAAYPNISLFVSDNPDEDAEEISEEDISTAESVVLAFSILFVLSVVSLFSGLFMTIVGYLHSTAYYVRVPPLPGWYG